MKALIDFANNENYNIINFKHQSNRLFSFRWRSQWISSEKIAF